MKIARHAACVMIALLVALAPRASPARDRSILWTVKGTHNTVYLLGSIHVLRPGDGGLSPAAEAAYADAERLVMEIDLDDPATSDPVALLGSMQRTALLPEGASLRSVLGNDYTAIDDRARLAGVDLASFDRYAPWLVAVTLMQVELARRGFTPEHGIEYALARRADEDGKAITGLETAERQFAAMGSLTLAQQKRFLMMTLEESDQIDAQLDEMLGAWRAGDATALARVLSDEFDEFPELYRPLTEDRNRAWLGRLVDLLDDRDDYLVVVGALHLVGRHSVVDLLEQRGYEVVQQ